MSHQCIADAFAPWEIRYKAQIMAQTWGHLAPKKGKTYSGYVVFALGCFGSDPLNPTPLECELNGLDSSPWFFDALIEFLQSIKAETGGVYRWDGTFRNYEFVGVVQRLRVENSTTAGLDAPGNRVR